MQKIKTLNIIMIVVLLFSLGTLVASFFSRYWISFSSTVVFSDGIST